MQAVTVSRSRLSPAQQVKSLIALRTLAPLGVATILFALNRLAILSGWLNPPEGYTATLMVRAQDVAQYLTWIRGFEEQVLLPNYHAPWLTEPAFFTPFFWLLSQTARITGVSAVVEFHLFQFLLYVVASYSLFYALRTFTETWSQAFAASAIMLLSVPLKSLAVLPSLLLARWQLWPLQPLPGIEDFVWASSDGFFHGISSGPLMTFGTASAVLGFSLLARYLKTGHKRFLAYVSAVAFLSAFVHPFEVFVLVGAGCITLFLVRRKSWISAIPELAALILPALTGLAPYLFLAWRYQWLRDASDANQWAPGNPIRLLVILGVPTVLALGFLIVRPRMASSSDLLLQIWVASTLVGIYFPWMHWSQHLLDGFHYAVGLLLARQIHQTSFIARVRHSHPRMALAGLSTWVVLSLAAYPAFYWQSFKDGRTTQPERLFTSVAPTDEIELLSWMQQNAQRGQLVLAPPENAPWMATALMNSFASHWVFSLTYQEQARLSDEFYAGRLDSDVARGLLDEYGVRYVVLPLQSPASIYMEGYTKKAEIASFLVYEINGNLMKPYAELPR